MIHEEINYNFDKKFNLLCYGKSRNGSCHLIYVDRNLTMYFIFERYSVRFSRTISCFYQSCIKMF